MEVNVKQTHLRPHIDIWIRLLSSLKVKLQQWQYFWLFQSRLLQCVANTDPRHNGQDVPQLLHGTSTQSIAPRNYGTNKVERNHETDLACLR